MRTLAAERRVPRRVAFSGERRIFKMEYYVLLGSATLIIAVLLVALYRRQRDMGLVVGFSALYYWSLYGGWFLVIDKLGGSSGQHYHYLESKMFPVALDGNYFITLAVYAVFIIATQLTMLALLPATRAAPVSRLIFRHEPILLLGFVAGIASYLLVREKLSAAWTLNTSAYWYTRSQTGPWFTVHQVLNRVALIPPSIGLATLVAGARSRYFVSVATRFTALGYLLLFTGMCTFTFVLGNKNEVFTALLTGMLAYLGSLARPDWRKVALVLGAGLWYLAAVDFFRGTPVSRIAEVVRERYEESTDVGHFVTTSDEAFAAHFPALRDPDAELLDFLRLSRRYDKDSDLAAFARVQILQLALGTAVPRPKALVAVQEQTGDHVRVEPTRDVARIGHELTVRAEERADYLADLGLADTLWPSEHERRANFPGGVLHYVGEPSNNPVIQALVPPAHVVPNVSKKFGAVAVLRLDREPVPEVVLASNHEARRVERDALVLPPLRVSEPEIAERRALLIVHDELVREPLFERTDR